MRSEFGGNRVFNLPGSVCDAFLVKSQDQLDKGSWRALKNSTVNADGGSSFANGEVDQFGANESNNMGSGTFQNVTWKSDPSQVSGNYGAQTSCRHYEHLKHWKIPLNNVGIGRKTGRWHSTWKTRRALLLQKYY